MSFLTGLNPSQGQYRSIEEPQESYIREGEQGPEKDDFEFDVAANEYYDEVASLRESIRIFSSAIQALAALHAESLSLTSPNDALTDQIDALTGELQADSLAQSHRLAALSLNIGRDEARRGQFEALKASLSRACDEWRGVEMRQREKVRERVARQYRIVKPDANDEEVKAVLETDQGASIFMQAVAGSRSAGAQEALSEATMRRAEVQKLEASLAGLAMIMNQVAALVAVQDTQFTQIEQATAQVEGDIEKGTGELGTAKASAMSARKKRIWCAAIGGLVLLIIIIIIATSVGHGGSSDPNSSTSSGTATHSATGKTEAKTGTATAAATGAAAYNNGQYVPAAGGW